ncbi:Nitroreductase [Zopfia rhizophila CBS 207.26]|uniref:Nitroreductase n=1 Tax=Zopfia rhizophila CBS 207.26 TaxID=1314779 RepID=A0A6A6DRJ5_9PEZI|nr:Nitroreductase [Zopfia rhizophila CBS 207.26]
MASTIPFLTVVTGRRSMYALSKESPISNDRILEIVEYALKHAQSPFNVRSTRCIVLLGEEHSKLWEEAFKITAKNSPEAIGVLGPKIKGFVAAYGTCMFFDDSTAYNDLTPRFAILSKQYPEWEEHSSGMHQFIVWAALEAEGLGCNLQHYQPSIAPYVSKAYNVPESWTLKC